MLKEHYKRNGTIVDNTQVKQAKKALKELKKIWGAFDKEFEEATKGIRKNIANQKKQMQEIFKAAKDEQSGYFSFRKLFQEVWSGSASKSGAGGNSGQQGQQNNQDSSSSQEQGKNLSGSDKNATGSDKNTFESSFVGGASEAMSKEFSKGLADMVKGYKNFSDVMKDMTNSLMNYMLESFTESIAKMIFNQNTMSDVTGLAGGLLDGVVGGGRAVWGMIRKILPFHSGGVIPSGANYKLPGTQEQLALLKGGERVLSPSENTSYENGGGTSPVVFNNFNIKAWDSKDVQRYLLENKQLLNSITYEGIKNNNCHLRHMVQNA